MSIAVSGRRFYPPGDLAMWIFILAELTVFGLFFSGFAFARAQNVALFNESQQLLNQTSALFNTLALISSSYCVVRAVVSIREDRLKACIRWLGLALVFGGLFLVVKSTEYAHHYAQGINLRTNLFFMFYFSLTFFHFMHVILGLVILAAVAFKAHDGAYSSQDHTGVETGASYWHMVDLVWLILFPLVYVMQ